MKPTAAEIGKCRRDIARFIRGDIITRYSLTHDVRMQPKLLFRVLQAMYAIQDGITKTIQIPLIELREQIVGQFHKEYPKELIFEALQVLKSRNLVWLHENGCAIKPLGQEIVVMMLIDAVNDSTIKEYTLPTRSPNIQGLELPVRPKNPTLRIVH